jgi:putative ABC transport system permease protein
MSNSKRTRKFRFWLGLIRLIGVLVPRRFRVDWRQQWEAELRYREEKLGEWDLLDWRSKLNLLYRSTSAFWDALWLQTYRWEDAMIQDLRYGVRMLLKNPGFTFIAMLTLAVGIGANSAIFSVINGVLLRPLPFAEPDRLVMLWTDNPAWDVGLHELPMTNSDLPEWRANAKSFEQIAAFQSNPTDLSDDGNPQRVGGVDITANLLPMLGVNPVLGRGFAAEDETPGQDRLVLISHALWQQRFGGTAEAIGRTITVNQVPRQIIGVLPEGFNFPRATEMPRGYDLPERTELWMPLARTKEFWERDEQRSLVSIARLKTGVTQSQAKAEMNAIAAHQAIEHPQTHEGWRVWLTPLFSQIIGQTRTPLLVLLGAVGFLLLIACANIASLLLARGAARRREMAVRTAIGAGRARIIRQLLTESLLLAMLGGSLGIVFGYVGLDVLLRFIPPNVPRLQNITLDGNVLVFTALITLLTGALFGLVPAWQASRLSLAQALNISGRMNSAAGGSRSSGLLVTVEFALAVVLLIGASLMLQSFRRLLAVDPGFRAESVTTFDLSPSWTRWDVEKRDEFFEQARTRLSNLHGVRELGAISRLPLSGNENMTWISIEGMPAVPRGKEPVVEDRLITPGYFAAMRVNLIAGRDFDSTDSQNKPPVVIVNETLARQFFSGGDAIGKRIRRVLDDKDWGTIVGVVRDVRGYALQTQARPQFYHPLAQAPREADEMTMVLRVDDAAMPSLRASVQQEINQLDPTVPVANFRGMEQLVANAVARPRFSALLLGLFAAIALLLTLVGIYGVVAHGVQQRTREIGIRMALGAQQSNVLSLVIRQGMKPALIGLAVGITGAFALMRLLTSQFYEVRATDPMIFAVVGCSLLLMALAACYIPARRAVKIDPMVALRHE